MVFCDSLHFSTPLEQLELALEYAQREWERGWRLEQEQQRQTTNIPPVGLAAALFGKPTSFVTEPSAVRYFRV